MVSLQPEGSDGCSRVKEAVDGACGGAGAGGGACGGVEEEEPGASSGLLYGDVNLLREEQVVN